MSTHLLDTLGDSYIVCGRGQRNYNSNGNKTLRNMVAQNLPIYINQNTSRSSKSKLVDRATKEIFGMGMVFVKLATNSHTWETLSYAQARAKVAHRFRDAARRVYSGNDELSSPKPVTPEGNGLHDCSSCSDASLPASSLIDSPSQEEEEEEEEENKRKTRPALHDSPLDSDTSRGIKYDIEVLMSKINTKVASNFRKDQHHLQTLPPPTNSLPDRHASNSLTSLFSNAYLFNAAPQQEAAAYFEDDDMINNILARQHHLIEQNKDTLVDEDLSVATSVEEIDERIARLGGFLPEILFDDEFSEEPGMYS